MKIISIDGSHRTVKADTLSVIRVKRSEYTDRVKHYERELREASGSPYRQEELPIMRRLLENYKASGNAYLEPGSVKLEILEGQ